MQQYTPMIPIAAGAIAALMLLFFAFSGPSSGKAQTRRINTLKERHGAGVSPVEAQMRKITSARPGDAKAGLGKLIPNPALLQKRLTMTGKTWTLNAYLGVCLAIFVVIAGGIIAKGAPILLGIFAGLALGLFVPHFIVGSLIKKRVANFTKAFPDAIDLMVRGLRSGLPITEALTIVSAEIEGPVGIEFKAVSDGIRIGKTMDEALQETAERLGTPEFQFFCITIAIQRETGGNLAETLSNLSDVLRKRAQMKLKIKAMSSEAKASAYIVGALPFIVFGLVYTMNPEYVGGFFTDQRLMVAGLGGLLWMSMGVAMMAKMINFEI